MLRCHSINAAHVMPLMCVTYHQIRFVWIILVPPYCSVPHKPFLAFAHSLTLTHSTISSVECHTRIKAWMSWKRSYHTVVLVHSKQRQHISNERCSIFRTINANKTKLDCCIDVYSVSIHFVWGTIFRILNWTHSERWTITLNSIWNWHDP